MTYDEWKTQSPPEEPENNCSYCGEPCEGTFCSRACYIAELND